MSDEKLPWDNFRRVVEDIRKECATAIGEGEVPWATDETVDSFIETISAIREGKSLEWISRIQEEATAIGKMTAADANRLHAQLSSPPAVRTNAHSKTLNSIVTELDKRLSDLSIEWLVEKFKELPSNNKIEFVRIVQTIIEQMQRSSR